MAKKEMPPVDVVADDSDPIKSLWKAQEEIDQQESKKARKQQEALKEKVSEISFRVFDWAKITGRYKDEKVISALNQSIKQIQEAVIADALKANLPESDEKGLEELIKSTVAREIDKLKDYKMAQKVVAKKCGEQPVAATPVEIPAPPVTPKPKDAPADPTFETKEEKEKRAAIKALKGKYGDEPEYIDPHGDRFNVLFDTFDPRTKRFDVFYSKKGEKKAKKEEWDEEKLRRYVEDGVLTKNENIKEEEKTAAEKAEMLIKEIWEKFEEYKKKIEDGVLEKTDNWGEFRIFTSEDHKEKMEALPEKYKKKVFKEWREANQKLDQLKKEYAKKIDNKTPEEIKAKADEGKGRALKAINEDYDKKVLSALTKEGIKGKKAKLLEEESFRLKIESFSKFGAEKLKDSEKEELKKYLEAANAEIGQKKKEKITEIEALLAELEKVAPVPPVELKPPAEPVDPNAEKKKAEAAAKRRERIEQLKAGLEETRKKYVETDYQKNKAYKRLGRFFGNLFKEKIETTREADSDVAYWKVHYEKELFEYKNLLLEDAKESGVLGKDLGSLLKEIAVEDNIQLADVHNQVKVEHHEGRWSGFVKKHSMEIVQSYKKMPLYKKVAIGVAFGLLGMGMGTAGAAFAGVAGSAIAIRRAFMGMVTGTSVAMGLESIAQRKMEGEAEIQEKDLSAKLEGKSEEEIYNLLKEQIGASNLKEEQKLHKMKNKNLRNLAVGVGVGTFIGSGYASELFGKAWHKIQDFWQNNPGGILEGTAQYDMPSGDVPGAEHIGDALDSPFTLEIPEGSSLEGALMEHLEKHPEIMERYSQLYEGQSFDSGQIAHRMALEWTQNNTDVPELNLVHAGTKIELSPDGMHIESVYDDDNMGYLHHKASAAESISHEEATTEPEVSADHSPETAQPETPAGGPEEYSIDQKSALEINQMDGDISDLRGQISDIDSQITREGIGGEYPAGDFPGRPGRLDELIERKQLLETDAAQSIFKRNEKYAKAIFDYIGKDKPENLLQISNDVPVRELLENKESRVYKFFSAIAKDNVKNYKGNINPEKGETLIEWVARLIRLKRI